MLLIKLFWILKKQQLENQAECNTDKILLIYNFMVYKMLSNTYRSY